MHTETQPERPIRGMCRCGRTWNGLAEAHCAGGGSADTGPRDGCHEHFSTVSNFDLHRSGRSGCGDPRQMRGKDGELTFRASEGPYGTTWRRNIDRPEAEE